MRRYPTTTRSLWPKKWTMREYVERSPKEGDHGRISVVATVQNLQRIVYRLIPGASDQQTASDCVFHRFQIARL
jgi:hypothetical protein